MSSLGNWDGSQTPLTAIDTPKVTVNVREIPNMSLQVRLLTDGQQLEASTATGRLVRELKCSIGELTAEIKDIRKSVDALAEGLRLQRAPEPTWFTSGSPLTEPDQTAPLDRTLSRGERDPGGDQEGTRKKKTGKKKKRTCMSEVSEQPTETLSNAYDVENGRSHALHCRPTKDLAVGPRCRSFRRFPADHPVLWHFHAGQNLEGFGRRSLVYYSGKDEKSAEQLHTQLRGFSP
ncbi:hypothetical protein B0H13DRAFT_2291545 [Mycena leptocephala]|nr:hypothetical protein B0H13DRAFT_2291545 [Mycena leptocephala]